MFQFIKNLGKLVDARLYSYAQKWSCEFGESLWHSSWQMVSLIDGRICAR
jgi:hypothetical protein